MSSLHLDGRTALRQQDRIEVDTFVRRLGSLYPLQPHEIDVVGSLVESAYSVPAQQIILEDGQSSSEALVLLRGLACQYKSLDTARRQITGFVLPGDFCDYGFLSSSATAQSVLSLAPCIVGRIDLNRLSAVADRLPNVVVAAMRAALLDRSSSRELIVSLGARDALQRLAHLLCEISHRLRTVGLVNAQSQFEFPITQAEIGEALGLSTVHVNRTIQHLRRAKLITIGQGSVTILDAAGLARMAQFDPGYLKPR